MYPSQTSCSATLAATVILSLAFPTAIPNLTAFARSLGPTGAALLFEAPGPRLPLSSRNLGVEPGEASVVVSAARHVRSLQRRSRRQQGTVTSQFSFAQGAKNARGAEAGRAPTAPRRGLMGRIRDWWRRVRNRGRREISYPFFRTEEEEPGSEAVAMLVREYITPHQRELQDAELGRGFDQWLPPSTLIKFKTVVGWFSRSQTVLLERGRFLGRGRFGAVFEVTDHETKEHFALKAAVVSGGDRRLALHVFEEEFDAGRSLGFKSPKEVFDRCRFIVPLKKLKKPGEPPFLELRDDRALGNRFLLSPLAEGSLRELLRRFFSDRARVRGLGADVALLSLSLQIPRFGAILQALGVVHADINPNNILLTRNGLVYLADFGAVYQVGTDTLPVSHTLLYSPPEVLAARSRMEFSIDSWAIGCTMYEIWCNRVPYETGDLKIVRRGADREGYDRTPPFPLVDSVDFSPCLQSMPESIKKLVLKLVRLEPNNRLHLLHVKGDPDFLQAQAQLLESLAKWNRERKGPATPMSTKL